MYIFIILIETSFPCQEALGSVTHSAFFSSYCIQVSILKIILLE